MKKTNPVAKNNHNKPAVHPDKKKDDKAGKRKHPVDYRNKVWPDTPSPVPKSRREKSR